MNSNAQLKNRWQFDEDRAGEYEVRLIERAWDHAVRNCDVDSLIGMMADDYVVTNTSGNTVERSKILNLIPVHDSAMTSMDRDIAEVRVYGDTAIVIGRVTWNAGADERRQNSRSAGRQARYIKVYVKGPKGWQAVITQATRIEEEPAITHNTLSRLRR